MTALPEPSRLIETSPTVPSRLRFTSATQVLSGAATGTADDPVHAAKLALRSLGRRIVDLRDEADQHDALVTASAPTTLA